MKQIPLIVLLLVISSCATVQELSPFYDIREAQGITFYVCDDALLSDIIEALRAYAPVYGYTEQDIAIAVIPVAGELYVTESAMRHYLNFKTNNQSKEGEHYGRL